MNEFDREVTPFCDSLNITKNVKNWEEVAKYLERRSLLSEQKLRICLDFIMNRRVYEPDGNEALNKIRQLDE